ncbi:MAG: helix-turn-helix domain-containing protein [Nannocystales bacterium]
MPVPFDPHATDGVHVVKLGMRQRYRFEPGERHAHHCPRCYEAKPCTQECEFEPDLSEDADEPLQGSYCVCDECWDSAVLGCVLRHVRKKRGLQQCDVAKSLGVTSSTISRIENGAQAVAVVQLRQVAKALSTEAWMLLKDADRLRGRAVTIDTIGAYLERFDLLALEEND